jgi:hypothetical protein
MFGLSQPTVSRYLTKMGELSPELFPEVVGKRQSRLAVLIPGQRWRDVVTDVKAHYEADGVSVALELRANAVAGLPLPKWSLFAKYTGLEVSRVKEVLLEIGPDEAHWALHSASAEFGGSGQEEIARIQCVYKGGKFAVAARILEAKIRERTISPAEIRLATGLDAVMVRRYLRELEKAGDGELVSLVKVPGREAKDEIL